VVYVRLLRLALYIFLAALLWGYVSNNNNLPEEVYQTKQLFTATAEKAHRFINLSQAVKTCVSSQPGVYIPLAQIPLALQQALIATEDARFYRHQGIDFEGVARALFTNLQDRQFSEGGSTITQQLVKNLFLSQEKTLSRKLEELILAVGIELHFSKEEILEMYLNRIYYGAGAYGIASAADIYFGKLPKDLTLAESALLVGLPQAPSVYSPYANFQAAKQRQTAVLDLMVKHGFISPSSAEKAKREPVYLAK
jgi:penicillin-binding protein 1A